MAHVILLRDAVSFVRAPNAIYGTHEQVENKINNVKIPFQGKTRAGYCIPACSELKFINTRIKKECIPEYLGKIGALNLNPKTNNITLKQILFPKKNCQTATIGRLFLLIQLLFKWANNKKKTGVYLIIVGAILDILTRLAQMQSALFIWSVVLLLIVLMEMNPLRPSDIKQTKRVDVIGWHYSIFFGYLEDIDNGWGEEL